MHDTLTPAPLGPRIAAGAFDLALLSILGTAVSLLPMLTGGLALPLIGAFAALLAYSIVPCMLFRRTLGMALFGIEIVNMKGRNADATELLFRELFGRGLFGVAYFATVGVGIAGWLSGSMSLFQPSGAGLLLFLTAGLVTFIGVVGHFLAIASKDGRGLADLMAKTMVVTPSTSVDYEMDADEKVMDRQRRARRIRNFVVFEVALVASALTLPYALSRPSTGDEEFAARMEVRKAEQLSKEIATRNAKREATLRQLLAADPPKSASAGEPTGSNWDALSSLLELLEQQGRTEDARRAFADFVEREGSADARATYGVWLYDHDLHDAAAAELDRAIRDGAQGAEVFAYLGFALDAKGDASKARQAYAKALAIDPELETVRFALEALSEN